MTVLESINMPKCSKCTIVQAKLIKGQLCRSCYSCDNESNDDELNTELLSERNIVDLIKKNMLQEKKWNAEIINLLREQVDYLKNDIIHKNTLIEQLVVNTSQAENTRASFTKSDDDYNSLQNCSQSTSCTDDVVNDSYYSATTTSHDKTPLKSTSTTSVDMDWQQIQHKSTRKNTNKNSIVTGYDVTSENIYRTLIEDTESDFDKKYENHFPATNINDDFSASTNTYITTNPAVKRPNIVINRKNANDVINYKNPRLVILRMRVWPNREKRFYY